MSTHIRESRAWMYVNFFQPESCIQNSFCVEKIERRILITVFRDFFHRLSGFSLKNFPTRKHHVWPRRNFAKIPIPYWKFHLLTPENELSPTRFAHFNLIATTIKTINILIRTTQSQILTLQTRFSLLLRLRICQQMPLLNLIRARLKHNQYTH